MRNDIGADVWTPLIVGTVALLVLGGMAVAFLVLGIIPAAIVAALIFLGQVWNTYDTFVVKECWTLYLEEAE